VEYTNSFFSNSLINWNYGQTTLDTYKKLMSIYSANEEFKSGILIDYSSSDVIFIKREINGFSAWCLINSKNSTSTFVLPLELQNYSGTNLLSESDFSVPGSAVSLAAYEILVFK